LQGSGSSAGASGASGSGASGSAVASGSGVSGASSGASASAGNASGAGAASGSGSGGFDAGREAGGGVIDSASDQNAASPDDGAADVASAKLCSPGTAGNGQFTLTSGDPPEWQLAPGVIAGKLTPVASFLSPSYGLHFAYVVYTSANYVPGKPAVFLVFGDGLSMYLNGGFHAATVLDNLTATGDIPPAVALFIDPPTPPDGGDPTALRVQTYDPPTDKYPTFLTSEIIPAVILGKYSISMDPDAWAVIGYSASGGQGWNVVWKRPDAFHKFIGSNASYGAANVAMYGSVNWVTIISTSPMHDLRVSNVTCQHDLVDQRGSWLTIITNVSYALRDKGYNWRLMIGPNSHYPPIDGERDFPNSLRWMFQGCKFNPGGAGG
jgi:hypothetical protein